MAAIRRILRLVPALLAALALATAARAQSLEAPDGSPVILRDLTVKATLEGRVARVDLDETFANPGSRDLEAVFLLPLPGQAAVDGFSLWIDGAETKGELLDSGKARGVYEGIVRRRKDPGLLELAGDRLLRARVFPVPAGGERRIRVSWSEVLEGDGGSVTWRLPLRFPGGNLDASSRFSVTADLAADRPLAAAWSPTHRCAVDRKDDRHARVTWTAAGPIPDRDFVLLAQEPAEGLGLSLVPSRAAGEPSGAFLLVLAPGVEEGEAPLPRDMVLCLDTSGSMAGGKIEQAKAALRHAVKTLGPGDRFGLVAFSTEPRSFRPGLAAADRATVDAALAWIDRLEATGGTAMDEALRFSLGMLREGDGTRAPTLLFLTDGLPTVGETDEKAILNHARAAAGDRARAFVFGVGEDLNVRLMDSLAEGLRGARDYVAPQEDIERKVSALVDKTRHPVLTDLSLEVEGVAVADLCPRRIPDLFRGSEVVLAGRYEGDGEATVRVRCRGAGGERVFERKVLFPAKAEGAAFVDRLWAVRRVGTLMDQIRLHGEAKELKDEIVRLARRHGIVTPYTARLVLEDAPLPRTASRGNGPARPATGRRVPATEPEIAAPAPIPPDRTVAAAPARVELEEEVEPDVLETRPIDEQERVIETPILDESVADNESEAEGQEIQEVLGDPRFNTDGPFEGWDSDGFEGFVKNADIGIGGGAGGTFGGRRGGHRVLRAEGGGATDGVTEKFLEWLRARQAPDGSWGPEGGCGDTGLALLAYLGYGETHKTPRFGAVVRAGLKRLKSLQDAEGCFGPRAPAGFLRDHAVATLAMAEAYGLTQSPLFKASAQNGVNFLLAARIPGAGWGPVSGKVPSDILTTVWAICALKSAHGAGLDVDPAGFDAARWLQGLADGPGGPALADSERAGILFARILAGVTRDDESLRRLADQVFATFPGPKDPEARHFGTLAAFQFGGETWKTWNDAMKAAIIGTQREQRGDPSFGSWDPAAEGDATARLRITALQGLCLEVYYRYARVFGTKDPGPPPTRSGPPSTPASGADAVRESREAKSLSEATSADEAEAPPPAKEEGK